MRLLTHPHDAALLARVARPVREDEFGSDALEAFGRELATMMLDRHALGLASTQVDDGTGGEALAIFAIKVKDEHFAVMCNPEATMRGEYRIGPEACLSFESIVEQLRAPEQLVLRFCNLRGNPGEMMFTGLHARAVSHELEHLAGRTMLDRMSPTKRQMFLQSVRKRRHKLATTAHVTARTGGPTSAA